MITAQRVSIKSDLFICLGSSLAVFPAADLPLLAKETGANLVIINNELSPTQMDHLSDLVINRDISETLSEISRNYQRPILGDLHQIQINNHIIINKGQSAHKG